MEIDNPGSTNYASYHTPLKLPFRPLLLMCGVWVGQPGGFKIVLSQASDQHRRRYLYKAGRWVGEKVYVRVWS